VSVGSCSEALGNAVTEWTEQPLMMLLLRALVTRRHDTFEGDAARWSLLAGDAYGHWQGQKYMSALFLMTEAQAMC